MVSFCNIVCIGICNALETCVGQTSRSKARSDISWWLLPCWFLMAFFFPPFLEYCKLEPLPACPLCKLSKPYRVLDALDKVKQLGAKGMLVLCERSNHTSPIPIDFLFAVHLYVLAALYEGRYLCKTDGC